MFKTSGPDRFERNAEILYDPRYRLFIVTAQSEPRVGALAGMSTAKQPPRESRTYLGITPSSFLNDADRGFFANYPPKEISPEHRISVRINGQHQQLEYLDEIMGTVTFAAFDVLDPSVAKQLRAAYPPAKGFAP